MKSRSQSICFCVSIILCLFVISSPALGEPVNMLSLQEGTMAVAVPPTYGGWDAENMLDESPRSGWACESGNINNNVFVFEMVDKTVFDRFEFDNASVDAEKSRGQGYSG
jgi:hypothetical protein